MPKSRRLRSGRHGTTIPGLRFHPKWASLNPYSKVQPNVRSLRSFDDRGDSRQQRRRFIFKLVCREMEQYALPRRVRRAMARDKMHRQWQAGLRGGLR